MVQRIRLKERIVSALCAVSMVAGYLAPGIAYTGLLNADSSSQINMELAPINRWSAQGGRITSDGCVLKSTSANPAILGTGIQITDDRLIEAIDNCSVPYFSSVHATYSNSSESPENDVINLTLNIYYGTSEDDAYSKQESGSVGSSANATLTAASGEITLSDADSTTIPAGTRYILVEYIVDFPVDEEGAVIDCSVSVDRVINIIQDTDNPVVTITPSVTDWTNQSFTLTVAGTDAMGICEFYQVAEDGTATKVDSYTDHSNSFAITIDSEDDNTTYSYYAVDYAGHTSQTTSLNVTNYDSTAPSSPVTSSVPSTNWVHGETGPSVTFADITAGDGGSPLLYATSIDGEVTSFEGNTYTFTDEGTYSVNFVTVDEAGNVSEATPVYVKYDNTPPVCVCTPSDNGDGTNTVTVSATDALSGVSGVWYVSGLNRTVEEVRDGTSLSDSTFTANSRSGYTVLVIDEAGNTTLTNVSTTFKPVIAQLSDLTGTNSLTEDIPEDDRTTRIPLSITDDSDISNLTISVTCSNTNLFESMTYDKVNNELVLVLRENANGTGTVTVSVTDDDETPNTSTMSFAVNVTAVNDDPVALPLEGYDSAETTQDTPYDIDVSSFISDVDGDALTVSIASQPANATVTMNEDGTIHFVPDSGWFGETSFTYTVSDGHGGTDTASVTVIVNDIPEAPIARNVSATINEDNFGETNPYIYIDVLSVATDADIIPGVTPPTDVISILSVGTPALGTAQIVDGMIRYTPNLNAYGTDSFTFTITDSTGNTDTAEVEIEILPVNDAPTIIGLGESMEVDENTGNGTYTPATFTFTVDDVDNDNSELMVQVLSSDQTVVRGDDISVTREGDTVTVSFTPAVNTGDQTINLTVNVSDGAVVTTKTVTVNINDVNEVPVAVDDDMTMTWIIEEHVQATVNAADILANDTDGDNDTLQIVSVTSNSEDVTVTLSEDGSTITILSDEQIYGNFTFTYEVTDGRIDAPYPTATVNYTIREVFDAPVVTIVSGLNVNFDEYTGREGAGNRPYGTITFTVTDADTVFTRDMIAVSFTNPILIDATVLTGPDEDGIYTLKILAEMHEAGRSVVTIAASDSYTTSTATSNVRVNNIPDAPVAVDDNYNAFSGAGFSFMPTENDYDYDLVDPSNPASGRSNPTILSFEQPSHGRVRWNVAHTALIYTAEAGYEGEDSFKYTITDSTVDDEGNERTATATVHFNVNLAEYSLIILDAPEYLSVKNNTSSNFTFTAESLSGNGLSVNDIQLSLDDNGRNLIDPDSVQLTATGNPNEYRVSYTTLANVTGYAILTIDVTDSSITDPTVNNSVSADVKIFVKSGNTAPVAVNYPNATDTPESITERVQVNEGSVCVISSSDLINSTHCTDEDGDPLSISNAEIVSGGVSGAWVTVTTNGIEYHPYDGNFYGNVTLRYTVTDGTEDSDYAYIFIRYNNVQDRPYGYSNYYRLENTPGASRDITIASLLSNDYDYDSGYDGNGKVQLYFIPDDLENPTRGTISYNSETGVITYTRTEAAPEGTHGRDVFYYYISDVDPSSPDYDPAINRSDKIAVIIELPFDYLHGSGGVWRTVSEDATTPITCASTCGRPEGSDIDELQISFNESSLQYGTINVLEDTKKYNGISFEYIPYPNVSNKIETVVVTYTVPARDDNNEIIEGQYTSVTQTFYITIVPVNDAPYFDESSSVLVPESGNNPYNISFNTETGNWECDESGQMVFDLYYGDIDNIDSELTIGVTITNENPDHPIAQENSVVYSTRDPLETMTDTYPVSGDLGHVTATVPFVEQAFGHVIVEFNIYDGMEVNVIRYEIDVREIDAPATVIPFEGTIVEDSSWNAYISNNVSDADTLWSELAVGFATTADGAVNYTVSEGSIVTTTENGTFTYNTATGKITYEPNENFFGDDTIYYQVRTAGEGKEDTASAIVPITIHVTPVNDDPFFFNLPTYEITNEDEPVTFTFNAFDIEGDVDITFASSNTAVLGDNIVTGSDPDERGIRITGPDANNQYTVTLYPQENANGTVTLTINVADRNVDAEGNPAPSVKTKTMSVIIAAVNDAPVAVDDPDGYDSTTDSPRFTVNEINAENPLPSDTTGYQINVLTNDYDVESVNLTVSEISSPSHGQVTNLGNGNILYVPNANYNGDDSFTYTIKDAGGATASATVYITVEPLNTAPTAQNTTVTVIEHQTSTAIDLNTLVSDIEVDSGESGHYSFTLDTTDIPTGDSYSFNNGVFTYTAERQISANTTVLIPYTVSDNDDKCDAKTASGVITVNIIAVSDPPSIEPTPDREDSDPVDITWAMDEDVPATFYVVLSDEDTNIRDLMFVYELQGDYQNLVRATDITVTTTENGKAFYIKPLPNQSGSFTIVATVSDNNSSVPVTINVIVRPVNDVPVANNYEEETSEETPLSSSVSATDVEDGTNLTYRVVTQPSHGTVNLDPDTGNYTYTPETDYNGTDSFTYVAVDSENAESVIDDDHGHVVITVTAVNDNPVAENFAVEVNERITDVTGYTANLIDVFPHVTDSDLNDTDSTEEITITAAVLNGHGTANIVTVEIDGVEHQYISYVPALYDNHDVTIEYTVHDSDPDSEAATATITVTVLQVDTEPGHNGQGNDSYSINEDSGAHSFNVLINDDVDSTVALNEEADRQTLVLDSAEIDADHSAYGTVSIVNNQLVFTPNDNYHTDGGDPVVVTYTMHDVLPDGTTGHSHRFTASISINNVNDAPVILTINGHDATGSNTIPDYSLSEDAAPFTITCTAGDIAGGLYNETANENLQVTISSSNSVLIGSYTKNPTVNADGSFNINFTLNPNAYGYSTITVTVRDLGTNDNGTNVKSVTKTFRIWVSAVDDIPDPVTDTLTIDENGENISTSETSIAGTNHRVTTPYNVITGGAIVDVLANDDIDLRFEGDAYLSIVENSIQLVSVDGVNVTTAPAGAPTVTYVASADFEELYRTEEGAATTRTVTRNAIQVIPDANWTSTVSHTYVYSYQVTDKTLVGKEAKTGYFTVIVTPVNDDPTITITSLVETTDGESGTINTINEDLEEMTGVVEGWATVARITVGDEETAQEYLRTHTFAISVDELSRPVTNPPSAVFDFDSSNPASENNDVRVAIVNNELVLQVRPNKDQNGTVRITVEVTDEEDATAQETFDLVVLPRQDDLSSGDDYYEVAEDSTTVFAVTVNDDVDTDTEGEAVTITGVTQPASGRGRVEWTEGSNTITYIADENYYPQDGCTADNNPVENCDCVTFTYTAKDDRGSVATFTVRVHVTPVNDAPEVVAVYGWNGTTASTTATTAEGVPYSYITVVVQDVDTSWDSININSITSSVRRLVTASTGVVLVERVQGTEAYFSSYKPDGVTPDNTGSTSDTSATVNVAVFTYTVKPNGTFNGTSTLGFTANDGHDSSNQGTIPFNVTFNNDPPVPNADTTTIYEGSSLSGWNIITNDTDPDLATNEDTEYLSILPDSVVVDTNSAVGYFTVGQDSNGHDTLLSFTLNPGYEHWNGTITFHYTVQDYGIDGSSRNQVSIANGACSLVIAPVNDAPVASDSYEASCDEDSTTGASVNIMNQNYDLDINSTNALWPSPYTGLTLNNPGLDPADTLTIDPDSFTGELYGGSLSFNNNVLTYVPAANFNGTVVVHFTLNDAYNGSDEGTVTFTVNPVNDAPVASDDYAASCDEDSTAGASVNIMNRNYDLDINSTNALWPAPYTGLTLNNPGLNPADTLTIDPDSFTGELYGGSLDFDPATNELTYVPAANFNGTVVVHFTLNDAYGESDEGTVTFTVNPVNDAPVASDDYEASCDEDSTTGASVNIMNQNYDLDINSTNALWPAPFTGLTLNNPGLDPADTLTIDPDSFTGDLKGGRLVFNPTTNVLTYIPAPNFNGTVVVHFILNDAYGESDEGTVTFTVNPVNDTPVATDTTVTLNEDTEAVTFDATSLVTDVDFDDLNSAEYHIYSAEASAVQEKRDADMSNPSSWVEITPEGIVTFRPQPDFNGIYAFTYRVTDSEGAYDTGVIYFDVLPVYDNPEANDDTATILEDGTVTINVLANDVDEIDSNPAWNLNIPERNNYELTVDAIVTAPVNGTAVINSDNTITYTPRIDFNGEDRFEYRIVNKDGSSDTAWVVVTVTPGTYALIIDRDSIDFGNRDAEYTDIPAPQTVTVRNVGTKPLNITVPGLEAFIVVGDIPAILWPGQSFTVTIQPRAGLAPGTYSARFETNSAQGPRVACTLNFVVNNVFKIIAEVGEGGTINHDLINIVGGGTTVVYTFTPHSGYVIVDVIIDGVSMGPIDSYTFANISSSHTVEVIWGVSRGGMTTGSSAVGATGEDIRLGAVLGVGAIVLGAALTILAVKTRRKENEEE